MGKEGKVFRINGLEVDAENVSVKLDGEEIKLTPSEFKILKFLLENYGKVVSRDRLMESVWGCDYNAGGRTVDVHIKHLRDKLGEYGKFIRTVRGFGYKFEV